MEYQEFLNNPKVNVDFNYKFSELKKYFSQKLDSSGFSKEYTNLYATKMALVNTDFYFTELFKDKEMLSTLVRSDTP